MIRLHRYLSHTALPGSCTTQLAGIAGYSSKQYIHDVTGYESVQIQSLVTTVGYLLQYPRGTGSGFSSDVPAA